MSKAVLARPHEICTETFLEIGPFDSETEASNVIRYLKTKFFRTLVSIQKQTQNASKEVYRFVPLQDFRSDSKINWDQDISGIDRQLFEKYLLDEADIRFIETNVQEMVRWPRSRSHRIRG